MDNNYQGESFLNRLYKDLHMSDEVMHTALPSDTKDEKVSKYLSRLEKIEELAKNSKYNGLELLKELYYKKYVIKPENVPESYFELQKKIALERGFGHVDISNYEKKQMIDTIINDQKKSLDTWLDYLMSDDVIYPEWFKYYAFQGMIKLGSYDKEKSSFNKRTDSTTNVFIDLNREALALVYDNLCNSLEGNKVDDQLLQKLLDSGSFSKLYSYLLNKLESANKDLNSNDGIWIKYNKGSDPLELVKSLEGKGTGWCTAGVETARSQLRGGDFYIYYTKDSNNEYKQPRIAIRMQGSSIGEIRGIASNQNLEPEMEEVVDIKLQEFPDKDKYKKKVSDMKLLTEIYNNYKNSDLTIEELRFLYEVDSKIEGFGYQEDPRINEILAERNFKKDLSKVFDCSQDEISNNKYDVLEGKKIVCFYDNLDLRNLKNADGLKLPTYVKGYLNLSGLTSIKSLIFPNKINGYLSLNNLESAEELKLPNSIGESLDLCSLKNVSCLVLPDYIGGSLLLWNITNADGLKLPTTIGGSLELSSLTSIENLIFPSNIGADLDLSQLKTVKNLTLPDNVGNDLYLRCLESAEELKLPTTVGGDLDLSYLDNIDGLTLPITVGGNLNLSYLEKADNLILPTTVGGELDLGNLRSIESVKLPIGVGSLNLHSLVNSKGLILPSTITGSLVLSSLRDAEDLILPSTMTGSLDLSALINVKGLKLPDNIGGNLDLSALNSAKGLKFPDNIGGSLDLSSLNDAEGLILPNSVNGDLSLVCLSNIKNLKLPSIITGSLDLSSLETAEDLYLPERISWMLHLGDLINTDGLIVPVDFKYGSVISDYISIDDLKEKSLEINKKESKQKGFSKVGILILLNIIVSIGLIFLGVWFSL